MHTTSIAFLATLALALSATASPANELRSEDLVFGNVPVARHEKFGFGRRPGGRQGGRKGKKGKGGKGGKKATGGAAAAPPAATTAAAGNNSGAAKAGAAPPATAAPPTTAAPPASLANTQDLQSSTQLSPSVIQTTDSGQNPPVAGQANAATSKNNFINFCALGLSKGVPLTNGLQITTGSCNPTPIGSIPSIANMPSSKFQSPTNGATIAANTPFNITLQVQKIQLGSFTNAAKTYYANPQTLNAQGAIIGHTHIVVEAVESLTTTKLTDSTKFLFFKGINDGQDAKGNVQATVAAGLPAGTYRVGTILSSATHQPVIMPVAQHGLVDDVIYMTVTDNGKAAAPPAAAAAGAGAVATAAKAGKGAAAAQAAAKGAAAKAAAATAAGKAAAAKAAAGKVAAGKAAAGKTAAGQAAAAKGAAGKGGAKKGGK